MSRWKNVPRPWKTGPVARALAKVWPISTASGPVAFLARAPFCCLLISDGLDRDAGRGLNIEMERLHKSCRRLIWLNPLLRFDGFEPKSQGIRAILPHVDEFRPVHNLESLTELIEALNSQLIRRQEGMSEWLQAM